MSHKFTYLEGSQAVSDSGAVVYVIDWPAQGTAGWASEDGGSNTESDRIGNQIYPNKWTFNYSLDAQSSGSVDSDVFRVVIFQWIPDTTYEVPNQGNIFAGVGSIGAISCLNPVENGTKFHVLYDKVHVLTNNTFTQTQYKSLVFTRKDFPIKRIRFVSDGVDGTAAEIVSGSIWLACMSDNSTITNPKITFSSTFQFSDTH